ncbi:MAG: hypothetical protein HYT11_00790 [Candidatus Levybacteria bacterium]|nr:hypothetical protein [Candidatus Levybacteria bacterium]
MKKRLIKIGVLILIIGLLLTQYRELPWFKTSTAFAVGDLSVDWGIGISDVGPIFSVADMAPGYTQSKSVTVTNNSLSIRPLGIKGIKDFEPGSVSEVLDLTIAEGPNTLYDGTLSQFFINSLNPDGIFLNNLNPGQSKTYTFIVTFQQGAGNEFQNTNVIFDIIFGITAPIPQECSFIDLTGKFPIFGTSGNDQINGTTGDDVIFGFEGNDKIFSHGGNDCIIGGPGDDNLRSENGNDVIFGNEGNDLIIGTAGNDLLFGGACNDTIRGENGNDVIYGEDGFDVITGGNGDDQINGGDGDDDISSENGRDQILGGAGNDKIDAGPGNDIANGEDGNDYINGHSGTDTCDGEIEVNCEL